MDLKRIDDLVADEYRFFASERAGWSIAGGPKDLELVAHALRLVARTLDLPYAHVYGVATFYTMFRREPGGAQTIRMCTNISCMLRGGYDVLAAFEQRLGLKKGESNAKFTLVEEECIAACDKAPCAVVGTKYLYDITPAQVGDIIAELEREPHPEGEVV